MSGTSQLWAEIEKPEGSRSNKVARQSNWQTAGSRSRSSHSSCRIPSQRGEAQSYVWFFLFFFCELGWGNFWRSFQSSEVSGLMNPLKPLASKLAGMIGTGQSIRAWQPSASLLLPSSTILFKLITLLLGRRDNQTLMKHGNLGLTWWQYLPAEVLKLSPICTGQSDSFVLKLEENNLKPIFHHNCLDI